ncbi:MAG: restriction endonuclease subunit S [Prevotella sp.]|nr:restriction endonuclease subunit S [Prevotella sp.]
MEYKRLGDYIREVNVRNRDEKVTKLVGLTIDKAFIPSVANVIGTDLSTYKVIRREQFACSLMQVSRDGKMPVAMFEEDEAIMSPAYPMFEVIDKTLLLPKYLMMWFSRSEFDREASYYAVGGVRGSLTWEDFCNMRLPIPSIERQREIVKEYETLSCRISLNEQMIQKLEATAQALYRKMFVDGIDKENLPEGWRIETLKDVATLKAGGDKPIDFSEEKTESYNIPVYANGIENKGIFGYTTKPVIKAKSITISARGTIGYCFLRKRPYVPIVRLVVIIPQDEIMAQYLYYYLDSSNIKGSGSVQSQLTVPDMEGKDIIIPPHQLVQNFNDEVEVIDKAIEIREQENIKLTELQSLLLAKMGQ